MALLPALPVRADWRGRCPEAAEEEARRSRARLRSTVPAPTWRASYASCGWSLRVRRDRTAPATAAVSRDAPARAKRAGLDQGRVLSRSAGARAGPACWAGPAVAAEGRLRGR